MPGKNIQIKCRLPLCNAEVQPVPPQRKASVIGFCKIKTFVPQGDKVEC